MVSVKISPAGHPSGLTKAFPIEVEVPEDATISTIKKAIAAKHPKFYPSRQKLTLKGEKKALADDTTLSGAGISNGTELAIKDLGPQISWRTVFIIEYLGPLIIHPLFYFFPKVFYGGQVQHSLVQQYVLTLVTLHYLKRELETIFVHRFSHDTMPFRNIFKNSFHYWILGGVLLAGSVYRPKYSAFSPYIRGTSRDSLQYLWFWTAIWAVAEIANFKTHWMLRSLRPEGSRKRVVPYGFGFDLVTAPNYFFEIVAWVSVFMMTGSLMTLLFVVVGAGQMVIWAIKKHKTYKKEFGHEYPRNRKIIFPFVY